MGVWKKPYCIMSLQGGEPSPLSLSGRQPSTVQFLFSIANKILQTSSVVESTAAALIEWMAELMADNCQRLMRVGGLLNDGKGCVQLMAANQ